MVRRSLLRVGPAIILSVLLVGPVQSFAATPVVTYTHPSTDVLITEVQSASLTSSSDEFIELYNNTAEDIDLADTAHAGQDAWKLQYFSSSKLNGLLGTPNWASPFRTIALTGVVAAHDYYILAAGTYQPGNIMPDQTYASTLATDGGALQLIDSSTTGTTTNVSIHDQLAWSNDKTLVPSAVLFSAPGAGASLQRTPNNDSEYINDDNTLTSFTSDSRISPDNAWTPLVAVTPPSDDDNTDAPGDDTATSTPLTPTVSDNQGLPTPLITEILPNPASPQTDEADEFIELYNPGDSTFDLKNYTLETGSSTLHDFTFTESTLLDAHSFRAFFSIDTGLSLSNSGGQARLLDPTQAILDQSNAYSTAPEGQAWAMDETDGTWHWTTTPTPGADNVIHAPIVLAKASVVKTAKKKVAKVKGASTTKKAKKAKTTKKKTVKKVAASTLAANTTGPAPAPIHPGVLAAVAVLAVGYGVYEYRNDLANRIYQFRTHRTTRRVGRK